MIEPESSEGSASLLFATTNRGKLREARHILADLSLRVLSLDDFPSLPAPVEDQPTFEANARLKAIHYARLSNMLTIAEDSGLEVDALGGEPGVLSARYAGPGCDDVANNGKLIRALAGVSDERRSARFRCSAALSTPVEVLGVESGSLEGRIIDQPRGHNGFGYDPHFFVPELGRTTAEMTWEEKNRISHRGKALSLLKETFRRL